MTVTFESKINGEMLDVENVQFFTTDSECLGMKGISIHYTDGTFNLFSKTAWKLVMVKQ